MSAPIGEARHAAMTAGEAVFQVVRVYGPFGSTSGWLDILVGKLDEIRRTCQATAHRPPDMAPEQVFAVAQALHALGCIDIEGGMLRFPKKDVWTETRGEHIERLTNLARALRRVDVFGSTERATSSRGSR